MLLLASQKQMQCKVEWPFLRPLEPFKHDTIKTPVSGPCESSAEIIRNPAISRRSVRSKLHAKVPKASMLTPHLKLRAKAGEQEQADILQVEC